ncbi:hypothetical protein [Brucella anthropi]|uniref:hypothetical protein n=1 Tax=Brucella anthropi TaxID=529 RepID=UPI00124DDD00|nr:hypothetical protein [Brucella anthropi]KAB2724156.1 hypothetical protein F9K76_20320 [Brucella anthropi]KAB2739689.1 hypothetical protein F9K74_18475 [Brucella anthropi]KAB2802048.1 hypothetical protein F9K83_18470 [Brucella anthropi]
MSDKTTEGLDSSSEYPTISEKDWYALSIASAIVTVVVSCFVLYWVLYGGYPEIRTERISIAGAIVTFWVAVTTFCSVAWRGLISTKQIEETRRQIAVTEENNVAETLQKGAELISESSGAKVAAGIASLHSVMLANNVRLATAAQSLLLDYVVQNGKTGHGTQNITRAAQSLTSAYLTKKIVLDESAYFELDADYADVNDNYTTDWVVIYGISSVVYYGGNVNRQEIIPSNEVSFTGVMFNNCSFKNLSNVIFKQCKFYECKIDKVHTSLLQSNRFWNCDFSGATIVFDAEMPDMRERNNFVYSYDRPKADGNTGNPIEWKNVFHEFDEPVDFTFDDW